MSQGLIDVLDVDNLHFLLNLIRHILDILTVMRGEQDSLDARAMCPDEFLLDATDGHDAAAQANFSRHGDVRRYSFAGEQ